MEAFKAAPPSPYSSHLPFLQLAWDSTSYSLLQECARKYQYVMILHWQPQGMALDLDYGIVLHTVLENFQKAIHRGTSFEDAVLQGTRFCLSWDDSPYADHPRYPYKNRHTLARTFVWHCDQFKDDAFEHLVLPNGDPAVELSFRLNLNFEAPGGEPFLYCGHIDSMGTFQDELYFMDHKTTKSSLDQRYFSKYSPNTQMSGYYAASQVIFDRPAKGGIINAMQLLVSGTRFGRQIVHRTPAQLEEWEKDLHIALRTAQSYAEQQYWPMNTNACDNYGGCPFRVICSKDPSVRETFLKAEFVQRVWNPLETRGDL